MKCTCDPSGRPKWIEFRFDFVFGKKKYSISICKGKMFKQIKKNKLNDNIYFIFIYFCFKSNPYIVLARDTVITDCYFSSGPAKPHACVPSVANFHKCIKLTQIEILKEIVKKFEPQKVC